MSLSPEAVAGLEKLARARGFASCTEWLEQLGCEAHEDEIPAAKPAVIDPALFERVVCAIRDAVMITEAEPVALPGPRVVYVNPAFERLNGLTAFEVVGGPTRLFNRELLDPVAGAKLHAALARQEAIVIEMPERRPDGTACWVKLSALPVSGADGRCSHWIFIQRDISEYRRAIESLHEQNARLALALEVAGLGTWEADLSTGRLRECERTAAMFGLPPGTGERTFADWLAQLHPEDRPWILENFRCKTETGELCNCVYRAITPDGQERHIEVRGRVLKDRPGPRAIAVLYDVTEHILAEQALLRSEARLRRVVETGVIGICFGQLSLSTLTGANDAYLQMLRYTRADLEAGCIDWRALTPPEDQAQCEAVIAELICTGACAPFEKEYLRKDGSRVPVLVGIALLEPDGDEFVCFVLDMSERVRAEEHRLALERARLLELRVQESERLDRLKEDFLSAVSHELRTPLANIGLAVYGLRRQLSPERQAQYLDILERECAREKALIDDLLDLQRLDADDRPLVTTALDIEQWLACFVAPFRERAVEGGRAFVLDIAPQMPSLVTELASLERLVAELLNNACKYTPEGERITVEVRSEGDVALLVVRNSGIHIEADQLERVFDKFHRLQTADRWSQGGTGLGLALARQLAERLGGAICAESFGQEVTFTVRLPLTLSG